MSKRRAPRAWRPGEINGPPTLALPPDVKPSTIDKGVGFPSDFQWWTPRVIARWLAERARLRWLLYGAGAALIALAVFALAGAAVRVFADEAPDAIVITAADATMALQLSMPFQALDVLQTQAGYEMDPFIEKILPARVKSIRYFARYCLVERNPCTIPPRGERMEPCGDPGEEPCGEGKLS